MNWALILGLFFFCFSFVVFFGAPYLPTLTVQQKVAFDLLNLKQGQTLLELGVGDGKVAIEAAKRGYRVIGYELNPLLFLVAYFRTVKYREQVKIRWGNFWSIRWPEVDAIFVFLLPRYMNKLHTKCLAYENKPLKLVSIAFDISNVKPAKTKHSVFLYSYK